MFNFKRLLATGTLVVLSLFSFALPALATTVNVGSPAYISMSQTSTTIQDQKLLASTSDSTVTDTGVEISFLVQTGDTGQINWYDSSDTFISSSTISMTQTSSNDVSITPPSNAEQSQLQLTSGSVSGYRYLWYSQLTNTAGTTAIFPAPDTSAYVNGTPTLQSITVSPTAPSIQVGNTQAFTATAHYSDGSTTDITTSATWTSSNSSIATMSGATATGVVAGSSTITAAYGGVSGTATLTVTAAPPPTATLDSITVSPTSPSIQVGNTQAFTAIANYSDGSVSTVTSQATWTSSDTSVATLSGSTATGVAAGSSTITATYGGLNGTATLTVTAAPPPTPTLESITISPTAPSVQVACTQAFTATANYSDGSTVDVTASAMWTSSDTSVATMSGATATGVAAGSSTITATYDGISGTATLTVTSPPTCTDTL